MNKYLLIFYQYTYILNEIEVPIKDNPNCQIINFSCTSHKKIWTCTFIGFFYSFLNLYKTTTTTDRCYHLYARIDYHLMCITVCGGGVDGVGQHVHIQTFRHTPHQKRRH